MDIRMVHESMGKGPPQVIVPNEFRWEFIEYIAFQRTHALYSYRDDHIVVTFPHMDHRKVQELIEDWHACAVRGEPVAVCFA